MRFLAGMVVGAVLTVAAQVGWAVAMSDREDGEDEKDQAWRTLSPERRQYLDGLVLRTQWDELGVSSRTRNAMLRHQISPGQARVMEDGYLLRLRNIGPKGLSEIRQLQMDEVSDVPGA